MSANKDKYRQLCKQESLPLLSRASWFDAVSVGKDWDALIVEEDGRIQAAMPYHILRRYGQKVILMPQLTMLTDIYIAPDANAEQVLPQLAEQLDVVCRNEHVRYCYLNGNWPEAFREALSRLDYQIEERHTHQLPPHPDIETIVARYSENKRRQYRRAKNLRIVDMSETEFYAFHRRCLGERGQQITYSQELLHALFTPLLSQGQAALWSAEDEKGQVLAAVGLVWDEQTCYYLLPVYWRPESKRGAMAWLTTEAIRMAGERGLVFDFEGGNEGGIARSYREFGGTPTTYYSAEKYYNRLFKCLHTIKKRL